MGNLAERYTDASRSGVYRVSDAAIPRAAAGEAGARLLECDASMLSEGWDGAQVLLVHGTPELAVLERLEAAARAAREAGRPFFAVLVDPRQALALPLLYKERGAL